MAQLEVYRIDPGEVDSARGEGLLTGDEAHHLLRGRRARPGDEIMVIDGNGTAWPATLLEADRSTARLTLGAPIDRWREPPIEVHLGLGLLKADRFGEAVNLAVQAGVGAITPLECKHSVGGWSANKQERTQRIALTAAKQCARGLVPPLHPPQPIAEWCIQQADCKHRFLLDPEGDPAPEIAPGERVALAIGPEGGFHEEEFTILREAGFRPLSLGVRRLRSETAAVVAVAMMTLPVETTLRDRGS